MRILFFGDVFGKPGRNVLSEYLPGLISEYKTDFVIINGENLADGKGLTERIVKPLWPLGVDAITSGNHLWDREESLDYIASEVRIVKPMNSPDRAPGHSSYTIRKNGLVLTVVCFTGQVFMPACDSPFTMFESYYTKSWRGNQEGLLFVDFHAESTAEKRAFGWLCDGKASALVGTHTHIQTADEDILPLGTAYISDVGMTGSHDSVIGVKKHIILERFLSSVPHRFETSDRGLMINAVVIDLDESTGKAMKIERIRRTAEVR